MKILVTGCAGFIGSSLCEKLIAHNHHVIGIDNLDPFYSRSLKEENLSFLKTQHSFKFYELDISDKEALSRVDDEFKMVIHLAAKAGVRPSIADPSGYIAANVQGTLNVLDYMLSKGVNKMVFASSSSVYGDNAISPFKENSNTDFPISPYAFTKKSCELLLYNYFNLYQVSSISLRFFTVYGPRQRPDLAVHKFFNAISEGAPIIIYGDGSTSRDYTYIDDTVSGIEKAFDYIMANDRMYEIINLGNNAPTRLKDLVSGIEEVSGQKAVIKREGMQKGDVQHTCADITKAQKYLGYDPQTKLLDGLKKFYNWNRERWLISK